VVPVGALEAHRAAEGAPVPVPVEEVVALAVRVLQELSRQRPWHRWQLGGALLAKLEMLSRKVKVTVECIQVMLAIQARRPVQAPMKLLPQRVEESDLLDLIQAKGHLEPRTM
jgi:hypothetical protein